MGHKREKCKWKGIIEKQRTREEEGSAANRKITMQEAKEKRILEMRQIGKLYVVERSQREKTNWRVDNKK